MNEQFKQLLKEFINETIIRRRGGEEIRREVPGTGKITCIGDVKITPKEARLLTIDMNSPFMQGDAFHKRFNSGVGERDTFVRRRIKKVNIYGDTEEAETRFPMLANYKIGEKGSWVMIPELYSLIASRETIDRAFGIGFVKNIENFPSATPGYDVPLAQIEFADDQKPPGQMNVQNMIGLAFVNKISQDVASEIAEDFARAKRMMQSKGNVMRDPIVAAAEDDND